MPAHDPSPSVTPGPEAAAARKRTSSATPAAEAARARTAAAATARGPEPARPRTRSDYRRRIGAVLRYLEANLDARPTVAELAAVAAFSPFHFHRVFRALVGEPVSEHVRRLRLERAARHLATTRRSVTRIAFEAGYEALEPFSRAFRAAFGSSPSAFRRGNAPPPLAPARAPSPARKRPPAQPGERHARGGRRPPAEAMSHIHIEWLQPMRVVCVRHTGPYDEVSAAWRRLYEWAGRNGLLGPAVRHIGISHDDPGLTAADRIRYDACLVLDAEPAPADGDIVARTIPGGEYAVVEHVGGYETMGETYQRLYGEWLPASGREPADTPAFELYVSTPDQAGPTRTLIHLPLEPRR